MAVQYNIRCHHIYDITVCTIFLSLNFNKNNKKKKKKSNKVTCLLQDRKDVMLMFKNIVMVLLMYES